MELIKKSKTIKISNHYYKYFGFFLCPVCDSVVERRIGNGKRNKSCGCAKHIRKHGMCNTKIYAVWKAMLRRCATDDPSAYKYYKKRGISVCKEWKVFENFYAWAINSGFRDGLEIDRFDNDGGYTPENCRFVTHAENVRNSRNSKLNHSKADMIRGLAGMGTKIKVIAGVFGVATRTVYSVVHNKSWVK
jgi:hypothetical protein